LTLGSALDSDDGHPNNHTSFINYKSTIDQELMGAVAHQVESMTQITNLTLSVDEYLPRLENGFE